MKQPKIYIYGKHAVEEALRRKPHAVRKVLLAPSMQDKKLRELIRASGVAVEPLDARRATSQVEGGAAHQGVIALISTFELLEPFGDFFASFLPAPDSALVLLSEVQDPHNVGAAIRCAAALGAKAVLLPVHKQSPITAAAIKASAGAAFAIPLVSLDNMQQAIAQLKKSGVKVYGLAADGAHPLGGEPFAEPALFVLGNEAQGIAPAAAALCDRMLKIPISPRVESLNVAAAAAVTLYAWSQKHPSALQRRASIKA